MTNIAPYLKAVTAALVAGVSVLAAAAAPLGTQDYLTAAVAFLTALGAVWIVPNHPKS